MVLGGGGSRWLLSVSGYASSPSSYPVFCLTASLVMIFVNQHILRSFRLEATLFL